jgi:colicin import membrane protein
VSSGNDAWDQAVLNAVEKTGTLPRDENGNMPSEITFSLRPRDGSDAFKQDQRPP